MKLQKAPQAAPELVHLEALLGKASVTPLDAGCQPYLAERLEELGFIVERLPCQGVDNLIARRPGVPSLAFAGHTDVVPAGQHWQVPPFQLSELGGYLYGRGIADMKGGIAAFLVAVERALATGHELPGLMLLLTSDEEGEAEFGSRVMAQHLKTQGLLPPWVLVGEPTARSHSGDTLRVGRRGAVSGTLRLSGRAGHVAYLPPTANLLHRALALGQQLAALEWDSGAPDFPGTVLHVTGLEHGDWLDNVTPSSATLRFNLRYSHKTSKDAIDQRIRALVPGDLDFQLDWDRPCEPYFSLFGEAQPNFLTRVERAVFKGLGQFPVLSTAGGASDGRFFSALGCEVIELGLPNASIHQANERVEKGEYLRLIDIYQALLESL
ncbi:succinyl-diaminopimelate desuccinylase [Gallaecimonas kandeliae]|uniref:succinyl-diaminopimelate desuccinylase n=1 Tax=Gallaecimonas kandeliae TaxID=3029055 RepID=UPI002649A21A|nr:succinyl-diaminopimelate desuccinylase [Gallaecimonas kandeliae]WKE64972.1 succinyl-diaminopimelate desuccinylase [Gallaecimonas kandeliae]